jgi:apolipoprotein N-acyltransferase
MLAVLGNIKVIGVLALVGVLGYGYVKIGMLESEVEKKSLEVKVLHNTVKEQRKYFEGKIKADLAALQNELEKKQLVEDLDVQDVDSVDIDSYDIWF